MFQVAMPSILWLLLTCNAGAGDVVSNSQQVSDIPSDTLITLERSCDRCKGFGPAYTLKISADGVVVYKGKRSVRKQGKAESRITQEQLRQLIAEFDKAKCFSWRDTYENSGDGCPASWLDFPSATTSIRINGRSKTIFHYYGCREKSPAGGRPGPAYPKELYELAQRIDDIVGTRQWTQ